MSRHSSDVVRDAERVVRRVSLRSVWAPILIAAAVGVAAALITVGVLLVTWHPAGMGI